jgi:hypothetical protein
LTSPFLLWQLPHFGFPSAHELPRGAMAAQSAKQFQGSFLQAAKSAHPASYAPIVRDAQIGRFRASAHVLARNAADVGTAAAIPSVRERFGVISAISTRSDILTTSCFSR